MGPRGVEHFKSLGREKDPIKKYESLSINEQPVTWGNFGQWGNLGHISVSLNPDLP